MCGEKYQLLRMGYAVVGSPPHVRGKVLEEVHACVYFEDHPRMCGEKNTGIAI